MKDVQLPTKTLNNAVLDALNRVQPGQRIRITHTVRIGSRSWPVTVEGSYRDVNYLATGIATQRVPADDIVVPTVHFTKDNGELSSVALDENTRVDLV
jgi:hypothetical protein